MVKLITDSQIVTDSWLPLEDDRDDGLRAVPVPESARLIVPLAVWQLRRGELLERPGELGLKLHADSPLEGIAPDLARFSLIAVHIARFGDGRGLSLARLLRERYRFGGELRAVGEVLIDQLSDMRRCGFNAFQLRLDQDLDKALSALRPFSESYQSSADCPLPLFKRRASLLGTRIRQA